MNIKKILSIASIVLLSISLSDCKKESFSDAPIIDLGGETWAKGPIDEFIKTNFTDTYNIEVKYKWDPYEIEYTKNISPVKEANVIPALEAIEGIWMKPYENVIGADFLRRYSPRQFVLAGSAEYNGDGTITLGEAENGRKITLLVINYFEKQNRAEVIRMLHTIHHEFAHVLHQNILYPRDFKQLNPQWYTASWFNTNTATANAQGLVTPYAKSSADEDFVETLSFLLVEGQTAFDAIVTANPGTAASILRTKESMIVDYFQKSYGIDFRALQTEVKAGIETITEQ
ncbi:substrate import-associated zinc metallohydrolase lipoprotein [Pedobacter sp. AW31-3R]|uniref:substrate import-associated zinc metallohydrolase lipoprotein n=1 Tax=Pedobacter sp. AW31-3R TaxID=3445781 RepID=UPI003FA03A2E